MAGRTRALLSARDRRVLRLGLVSSSPLVLAGLRSGLAARGGIEVAFECASLADLGERGPPQVDVIVAEWDAEPSAADIRAVLAGPPAVLLLPDDAARAADWLGEGITLLPDHASIDMVSAAAHAAASGLVAAPPALWRSMLRLARAGERASAEPEEAMTPREREVLVQMARGLGNREIAARLSISPHTAKFHVAQIIAKLDARSRAHAVAKAMSAGLVTEPD